jgi:hypothetical protein
MPKKGLVLTGARASFKLDGVKVMYSTSVNYSEEYVYEPVEPLDQLEVAEHVPTAYRVTLSSQHVRVITEAIKNREGVAIIPRLENVLDGAELTGEITDRVTGTVVAIIQSVKGSRYTINVSKGIVLTDVEFVAIRIRDESEVA